jgi:hypothetical protein
MCAAILGSRKLISMHTDACPISGAYTHAHLRRLLPLPNADIQRRLWRLVYETGLSSDASIGARDPSLQHCILLPGPGLLVTATRAQAPLLQVNCADLACVTGLDVLLLRFCSESGTDFTGMGVSACLIQHNTGGHIVAREGYGASVPPQGGILLRHDLADVPDWHVSHEGMTTAVGADLDQTSASRPETAKHSM